MNRHYFYCRRVSSFFAGRKNGEAGGAGCRCGMPMGSPVAGGGSFQIGSPRAAFIARLGAMRILALDHGTKRIGVALSDETRTIAQPLEYIPAEPFAAFLDRLKLILAEKEISLLLIGMPRNMDGSYGPAAQKVEAFVAGLKTAIAVPIKLWDERLTSTMANRILIQGGVRREQRKEKVDKMAAAILLQSYLDGI